jgi:LysM repeat protein
MTIKRWTTRMLSGALVLALAMPAMAAPVQQGTNILPNAGFEEGRGGWQDWWAEIAKPSGGGFDYAFKPNSFNIESRSQGAAADFVLAGNNSYRVFNNWDPFWAGVRQSVSAPAGARVRFTLNARVWAASTFYPTPSDPAMPARVRVGVDPNDGSNPFAGSVVWSGEIAPHNTWQAVSVEATVGAGGRIHVYGGVDFRGSSRQFMAVFFDEGSLVVLDGAATQTPGGPTATPTPGANPGTYTVQPGDSLSSIARRFNTTVQAIVAANNLRNADTIFVGQVLTLPGGAAPAPTATPAPGATATSAPGTTATPAPNPGSYTVQAGDTLGSIARRFNTTVQAIVAANQLRDVNLIFVGQVLTLPGGIGAPPAATAAPGATAGPTVTATPLAPGQTISYVVQAGDSLIRLARRFGTTPERIRQLNNLTGDVIFVGQTLVIGP